MKKSDTEKIKTRNLRGYYYLMHGHWPENEKAKITCSICEEEFKTKWDKISGGAKTKMDA